MLGADLTEIGSAAEENLVEGLLQTLHGRET